MGAMLGLMLGCGALLIWRSGPRAPQGRFGVPSWAPRRTELLRQAGIDGVGAVQLLGLQALCACVALVVVQLLNGTIAVAECFGSFAFRVPLVLVRRLRRRLQVALRDVWPDAIDDLASAVRAGMSLPEGLAALAARGPTELRPAFARFGVRYRTTGRFGAALDALKADLSDPVGDRVCETLRVARDVGGSDLGAVLRALSEMLRSDARTRGELETRQGWVVNAARLAVAAPWAVLLMLGTQSSTLRAYDSHSGVAVLAIGAAVCLLAYRTMLRIGRLPDERRVLP